ncbi:MAG: hypothetical protein AB1679_27205 [Actinomycetota bacterium]|jgi:hypothetical protein
MIHTFRHRARLAGLAVTVGVSLLGGSLFNLARAETSYGPDTVARAQVVAEALDAYIEAAKTCDLDVSRRAYQASDRILQSTWWEAVYRATYELAHFYTYHQNQVQASLGLEGDDAGDYTCADRVQLAEEQAVAWDEVVGSLTNSPPLNEYFNDLATMWTVAFTYGTARSELTGDPDATPQTPATEPDPAAAKERWLEFVADYPVARELIAFRNPALATEIDGLVAAVTAAFEGDPAAGYPGAEDALNALDARFSVAINMVDVVAQNYLPTRPTFDPTDWDTFDTIDDVLLTIFEIRDLIATGTPEAAAQVATEYSDWLETPLSVKFDWGVFTFATTAMGAAVEAYAAEQTDATKRTLLDALLVVEQIYVGQYWDTPELVQYYEENEGPGGGLPWPFATAPAAP